MANGDRGEYPELKQVENEVDPNVMACLPQGSKVLDAAGYGASYWTRTARIDTEQNDGSQISFFLKVAEGDNGKSMMLGEYESMKAIESFAPQFVPRPIAWGTFKEADATHFFVSEFREMDQEVPEMDSLCLNLAQLHKNSHSAGVDQFGFHVVTHNGSLPQDNDWKATWEQFYLDGMRHMLRLEEDSQGPPPEEMKRLISPLLEKVIPRLLRPMETEGRRITPTLVHGDFWHANTSTDVDTGNPLVFDASAFWGHNEYDLRTMARRTRYKFGPAWQKEYLKYYPAAHPQEDFDARSALYILRSELHDSALFPKNPKFRQLFIQVATQLVDGYRDGYEGWLASRRNQEPLTTNAESKKNQEELQKKIIDSLSEVKSTSGVINTDNEAMSGMSKAESEES